MPRNQQPIYIEVDHRERGSRIAESLSQRPNIIVETLDMALGDYQIGGLGGGVLVERKTVFDFVASIIDRRLFD